MQGCQDAQQPRCTSAARPQGPRRRVSKAFRVLMTGLAFAEAGVFSLAVAIMVPLIRLLPGSRDLSEMRSQRAIHHAVRLYFYLLEAQRVLRVRCDDPDVLQKQGRLVIANHPTLLDAWALMSFMPQADCIVKSRYYSNFFLGGGSRGAGYVPHTNGPQVVDKCVERLRAGRTLIIFPEGTRSPVRALGTFARGAAHIALRSRAEIVPVTIRCEPPTLYHGQRWWDVPDQTPTLELRIDTAYPVEDIIQADLSVGVAARVLTAQLEEYFEKRIEGDGREPPASAPQGAHHRDARP